MRYANNRLFPGAGVRQFLLLVILIVAWSGAARADMDAGIEAYKRGDYAAAWEAWTPLASAGDPTVQYFLGHLYAKGEGVARDHGKALVLFRASASQGDTYGQFALGYVYENGQGVEQDAGEAVRWYRVAADRGNLAAQNNLALMYEQGRGVARNYAQAYYWYARGTYGSGLNPAKAVVNLEHLLGKMTSAEIAAAERLLEEWKP